MINLRCRTFLAMLTCVLLLSSGLPQSYGQTLPDVPGQLRTLTGRIRWSKDMGVLPSAPGGSDPAANICSHFFVVASSPASGSEKPIAYDNKLVAKADPTKPDHYSCSFQMRVPSDIFVKVSAGMGDVLAWPKSEKSIFHYTRPWVAYGDVRPSRVRRSVREFSPPDRTVMLKNKAMYISFELIYGQQ